MNVSDLIATTKAYRTVEEDVRFGTLSHAYLVVDNDEGGLAAVLKQLAKIIMRTGDEKKDARTDLLIEKRVHVDVKWYPQTEGTEKVTAEDIADLISDTYIKPYEADKKLYVLPYAHKLNNVAQNKLLKTLEEPQKNVCILLGASSEYPIISTVKSRVKKLVIPPFDKQLIVSALSGECTDYARLKTAAENSDGCIERTRSLYSDNDLLVINGLVTDILVNMKSTADITTYIKRMQSFKGKANAVLDMLLIRLGEMQRILSGLSGSESARYVLDNGERYNMGSVIWAIESVKKAKEMLFYNTNELMVTEELLFNILEGKYKWQRL